jgi:hypothetical protein
VANGTTISTGGTEIVSSGGIISGSSGAIVSNGGLLIFSGGTIGAAAVVQTLSGGTAVISGTIRNSGTLFASGAGSLIEIAAGGVVSGGSIKIGNGVVEIGSGSEAVSFLSTGSGGLILDGLDNAYTGKVSGFGGSAHTNQSQFIDFISVSFATASVTYTPANTSNTSGTLTVTDGTHSASVTLVGKYTTSSFHMSAGSGGSLEITDPGVDGGHTAAEMVASGHGVVAPHGSFAPATLGYGGRADPSAGLVADRTITAVAALFGHSIAASFAAAAAEPGGRPLGEAGGFPEPQGLLSHPRR